MTQKLSNETKKRSKIKHFIYCISIWGIVGFCSQIIKNMLELGLTLDILKGNYLTTALTRAGLSALILGTLVYFATIKSTNKK